MTVTFYAELVMGRQRALSAHTVTTAVDRASGALFAMNRFDGEVRERIAFADLQGLHGSCTGNRQSFFGRTANLASPEAVISGGLLSGETGGGMIPAWRFSSKSVWFRLAPRKLCCCSVLPKTPARPAH